MYLALLLWNPLAPVVDVIHSAVGLLVSFTHNYGWALVLFAAIVKLVFWPLNTMQFQSMRTMQKLAPQVKALQNRYGKDKVGLNAATMTLYKDVGANPLASCLPMLVQLPIIASVYWAIIRDRSDFAHQSWLWIGSDVAIHSPHSVLGANLASPDYALLVLYMASMYLQTRFMTPAADPQHIQQQKIMSFISPVMVSYIGFKYQWPSALIIYWLSYNAFTITQQLYLQQKSDGRAASIFAQVLSILVKVSSGATAMLLGFKRETVTNFFLLMDFGFA